MGSQPKTKKTIASRGSASDQFPGKLHDLMTYTEMEGYSDIISWVRNGEAIMVHDSERLLKLLPMFGLSQTKYRSFERQLNMWHWERIISGPYKGGWTHPCFVRGNKVLCSYMSRNSPPQQHAPLHCFFDYPSKVAGNSSNCDVNDLNGKITPHWKGGTGDFDRSMMFSLNDVLLSSSATPKVLTGEPFKNTDGCGKSFDFLFQADEDDDWFLSRSLHISDNVSVPMSVLEPTPIREDSRPTIGNFNILLEPLSDETIDTLF